MSLDFNLYTELDGKKIEIFSRNITHNLIRMADKAGIYNCLWVPDESGFKYAKDVIPVLTEGLKKLKADPEFYSEYNSENGWGLYEHFVPFVEDVLKACEEYPSSIIYVSR